MNLEDILKGAPLEQDDWVRSNVRFGKNQQVVLVGCFKERSSSWKGYKTAYVVHCKRCSEDAELFGEGYFRSLKAHLKDGKLPCGCTPPRQWTKEQYSILCSRAASRIGLNFAGFHGEWKNAFTKILLECPIHGVSSRGPMVPLLSKGVGCPKCADKVIREGKRKSDTEIYDIFMNTKAFVEGTTFTRVDRKDKDGRYSIWSVYCPGCDKTYESAHSTLLTGSQSCRCMGNNYKEAYIVLLSGPDGERYIKFGISRNSHLREKSLRDVCSLDLRLLEVFEFSSTELCKEAEKRCLKELDCGSLSKDQLRSGHTETTTFENLNKVREIYNAVGGVLVWKTDEKLKTSFTEEITK